ncbi:MAG: hypothetical protein M0R06_00650 [Sphaerochaeta sp.]|jgi:Zn finger protein HypA/HybF involved in hydrogenase expression|nr:hypothetical protein [Sphaerochaeta sp.]
MAHEESGHVSIWTHRDLLCRTCGHDYENKYGQDAYCDACGSEEYDILAEYYD